MWQSVTLSAVQRRRLGVCAGEWGGVEWGGTILGEQQKYSYEPSHWKTTAASRMARHLVISAIRKYGLCDVRSIAKCRTGSTVLDLLRRSADSFRSEIQFFC